MCLFSRPVPLVTKTNIFAREAPGGGQYLAYSMTFRSPERVAMILPLPVAPNSGDAAVTFIDLSSYPDLFDDLVKGFPERPLDDPRGRGRCRGGGRGVPGPPLPVVTVGTFEASFVPTMTDFDRLDDRFRIAPDLWARLGNYEAFGFAVFKLRSAVEQRLHPIALVFPRADPTTLYFPTVHLHHGRIEDEAQFHHSLFCQRVAHPLRGIPPSVAPEGPWRRSSLAIRSFARPSRARGVLDGDIPCLRRVMMGRYANRDVYVPS